MTDFDFDRAWEASKGELIGRLAKAEASNQAQYEAANRYKARAEQAETAVAEHDKHLDVHCDFDYDECPEAMKYRAATTPGEPNMTLRSVTPEKAAQTKAEALKAFGLARPGEPERCPTCDNRGSIENYGADPESDVAYLPCPNEAYHNPPPGHTAQPTPSPGAGPGEPTKIDGAGGAVTPTGHGGAPAPSSLHTEVLDKTARLLTIREGLADLMAKVDAALAPPVHYAKDDPIFDPSFCKHDVFLGDANPENPYSACVRESLEQAVEEAKADEDAEYAAKSWWGRKFEDLFGDRPAGT